MPVAYEDLFNTITEKIFADIFNYTAVTLRNNVRLTIMNNGVPVQNMIYNNVLATLLPDTDNRYYLFLCSDVPISNLLAGHKGWVNLEDVLNVNKVCADFITIDDKMIPKRMVFGHVDHSGNTIIAIDYRAYKKLNAHIDTYLTIDVDTNVPGNREVMSHIPVDHENLPAIIAEAQKYPSDECLGFINGYVYRNDLFAKVNVAATDYYEFYHDTNVKFTFTIDLTHRNTYMNTTNQHYQDIVIIPRNLTMGETFTYDTVALVVRGYDGKGIYIPFIADDTITQLTHNSFSISSFVIDAAFDKLGIDKGELYVIVSDYSKNNTNVTNGALTEELYILDDTKVLDAMLNKLTPPVPCWTADKLASSTYGKYLVDMTELDTYNSPLIKRQVECLGYYAFIMALCQHNGEFKDLGETVTTLSIPIPLFWKDTELFPILYRDGHKIPHSRYTVTRGDGDLIVIFGVPYPLHFSDSVIQYELIVKPSATAYQCVSSDTVQGITIPRQAGSLRCYVKSDKTATGITVDPSQGYVELPLSVNRYYSVVITPTEYLFSFSELSLGETFVFMYDQNVLINEYPDVDITNGKTLYFTPTTKIIGTVDDINVLPQDDYEIYCNGHFMVQGIDFTTGPIRNTVDHTVVGGQVLVLQNMKFLKGTQVNNIAVHNTDRIILTSDIGYVVDGIIPRNVNNEAWVQGLSRLFINGRLVPFDCVTKTDTHFIIDPRYAGNGYIYQFMNAVSHDFYDAYKNYMDDVYFTNRAVVSNFFSNGYTQTYIDPVIITFGNKLYSSYVNEIIYRVLNNTIFTNFVNDDVDILAQLADYEYLKAYDALFDTAGLINKRFVDVYPGYVSSIVVKDLNKYLYIQRLVRLVLGVDAITDHMVVYQG